jgi:hypothetical protein
MKIGDLYGVNAIAPLADPDLFGAHIADPERFRLAEERIAEARQRAA